MRKFCKRHIKRHKKFLKYQLLSWALGGFCAMFFATKAIAPQIKNPSTIQPSKKGIQTHKGGLPKGKPPFLFSYFLYDITQEALQMAHENEGS